MYVRVEQNSVVKYPFFLEELAAAFPRVSFARPISDRVLSSYGIINVVPTQAPDVDITQLAVEITPVQVNGVWVQAWEIVNASESQVAAAKTQVVQELSTALTEFITATANTRRYDSVDSAGAKYKDLAPDSNDPLFDVLMKYKAEATALVAWNARCWATLEILLINVDTNNLAIPTDTEMLALMPEMVWP